jgi:hypothetical protein
MYVRRSGEEDEEEAGRLYNSADRLLISIGNRYIDTLLRPESASMRLMNWNMCKPFSKHFEDHEMYTLQSQPKKP